MNAPVRSSRLDLVDPSEVDTEDLPTYPKAPPVLDREIAWAIARGQTFASLEGRRLLTVQEVLTELWARGRVCPWREPARVITNDPDATVQLVFVRRPPSR